MKIHQTIAASVIGLAAFSASAANAATIFNGHEYQYVASAGITWTDALAQAQLLGPGWNLVSITSAAENSFVMSLLPAPTFDREHVWIGGSDTNPGPNWTWSNGDAFAYSDWWGGEPNNSGGNECCAAFDYRLAGSGWAWNDVMNNPVYIGLNSDLSLSAGFIAEAAVPEPAMWAMMLLGFFGVGFMLRKSGSLPSAAMA